MKLYAPLLPFEFHHDELQVPTSLECAKNCKFQASGHAKKPIMQLAFYSTRSSLIPGAGWAHVGIDGPRVDPLGVAEVRRQPGPHQQRFSTRKGT